MLTGDWVYIGALAAAFAIATVASPAGVSGAVLLLPFQVGVLGTPSPAVTPTNLLYNVVATPGAIYRYWRQGQTGGRPTRVLVAGTLPGVIAGSILRVELLPGPHVFDVIIAVVLVPLGVWLLVARKPTGVMGDGKQRLTTSTITSLALAVGCVGGIYGIGGGSILAPVLIGSGRSPSEVAPATLVACDLCGGRHLPGSRNASSRLDCSGLGRGTGARIGGLWGVHGSPVQPRLPEVLIRPVSGLLVLAIGIRYAWLGLAAPG